jgi:hypothetical protein
VGPAREKIAAAAALFMSVTTMRTATVVLLQRLLGVGAFISGYNRPLFSVFDKVYKVASPVVDDAGEEDRGTIFQLQKVVLNETALFSILAPMAVQSMMGWTDGRIYAVDASETGAGIVSAKLHPGAVERLWHHGRKLRVRGAHLMNRTEGYLKQVGFSADDDEDMYTEVARGEAPSGGETKKTLHTNLGLVGEEVMMKVWAKQLEGESEVPRHMPLYLGVMEVCGGVGGIGKACRKFGLVAGPSVELKFGGDLLSAEVWAWCWEVVSAGRVGLLLAEPPCTSDSLARTPKLRSLLQPEGFAPDDGGLTTVCNSLTDSCLCLCSKQAELHKDFGVDQPKFGYALQEWMGWAIAEWSD